MNLDRGVFLDLATVHNGDLRLEALDRCMASWQFYYRTTPDQLHERLADAQLVVTNKVVLDRAALAAAPRSEADRGDCDRCGRC